MPFSLALMGGNESGMVGGYALLSASRSGTIVGLEEIELLAQNGKFVQLWCTKKAHTNIPHIFLCFVFICNCSGNIAHYATGTKYTIEFYTRTSSC